MVGWGVLFCDLLLRGCYVVGCLCCGLIVGLVGLIVYYFIVWFVIIMLFWVVLGWLGLVFVFVCGCWWLFVGFVVGDVS